MEGINAFSGTEEEFPFSTQNVNARKLWQRSSGEFRRSVLSEVFRGLTHIDPETNRIIDANFISPVLHLLEEGWTESDVLEIPKSLYAFAAKHDLSKQILLERINTIGADDVDAIEDSFGFRLDAAVRMGLGANAYNFYQSWREYYPVWAAGDAKSLQRISKIGAIFEQQTGTSMAAILPFLTREDVSALEARQNGDLLVYLFVQELLKIPVILNLAEFKQKASYQMAATRQSVQWVEVMTPKESYVLPLQAFFRVRESLAEHFSALGAYDVCILGNRLTIMCSGGANKKCIVDASRLKSIGTEGINSTMQKLFSEEFCQEYPSMHELDDFTKCSAVFFVLYAAENAYPLYFDFFRMSVPYFRFAANFYRVGESPAELVVNALCAITRHVPSVLYTDKFGIVAVLEGRQFNLMDLFSENNDDLIHAFAACSQCSIGGDLYD